jgi:transposase-like protein
LTLSVIVVNNKSTMKAKADKDEFNLAVLAREYSNERKARALFESLRWPDGAVCPHCAKQGSECRDVYRIKPKSTSTRGARVGLWSCGACRKQFTVTVGTVLEGSHIPISKWLLAMFIMCSSKKGVSAHQMHRMLKVTYKTAWFLCHRIRFAMNEGPLARMLTGTVEVDETFVGGKGDIESRGARQTPVMALIERDGNVRTRVISSVTQKNLRAALNAYVAKDAIINTDQHKAYPLAVSGYRRHDTVNHSAYEYARKNSDGSLACTNTAESFFSLLKRGVYGSFHHVSREHLGRYADEFAFRWNNRKLTDGQRMEVAIEQVTGKRLTYRQCV